MDHKVFVDYIFRFVDRGTRAALARDEAIRRQNEKNAKSTIRNIGLMAAAQQKLDAVAVRSAQRVFASNVKIEQSSRRAGVVMGWMGRQIAGVASRSRDLTRNLHRLNIVFSAMRNLMMSLRIPAAITAFGFLAQAIGATAGGVAALVGALGPLSGALIALPGIAAGAAQAIWTLKAAFTGVQDAINQFNSQQLSAAAGAAGSAAADAAKRITEAERAVTAAKERAKEAEEALTQARKDAKREILDLAMAAQTAASAELRAQLALKQAKEEADRVGADPTASALERQSATLGVVEAEQALRQARVERGRAAQEADRADRDGVRQAPQVIQARRAQRDAVRDLRDAEQELKEVRRSGGASGGAQDRYAAMMKNLSAEAQTFVKFWVGRVQPALQGLQASAGRQLFPRLQQGITAAMKNMPALNRVFEQTGGVIGGLAERAGTALGSDEFGKMLEKLGGSNAKWMERLGRTAVRLGMSFTRLLVEARPFLNWLVKSTARIGDWIAKISNAGAKSGKFADFLKRTRQVLTTIARSARDFAAAMGDILGIGGRELGVGMLANLETLMAKFRKWTESTKGQNQIKQWFNDIEPAVYAIIGLIGDIGKAFLHLARQPGLVKLISEIRERLIPTLVDVIDTTTNQFGPSLVKLIDTLLKAFQAFQPALKIALGALKMLLDAVTFLLGLPLVPYIIGAVMAMKTLAAVVGVLGKMTGISTLIGGLGRLRASMNANRAAAMAMNAEIAKTGTGVGGRGPAPNYYAKGKVGPGGHIVPGTTMYGKKGAMKRGALMTGEGYVHYPAGKAPPGYRSTQAWSGGYYDPATGQRVTYDRKGNPSLVPMPGGTRAPSGGGGIRGRMGGLRNRFGMARATAAVNFGAFRAAPGMAIGGAAKGIGGGLLKGAAGIGRFGLGALGGPLGIAGMSIVSGLIGGLTSKAPTIKGKFQDFGAAATFGIIDSFEENQKELVDKLKENLDVGRIQRDGANNDTPLKTYEQLLEYQRTYLKGLLDEKKITKEQYDELVRITEERKKQALGQESVGFAFDATSLLKNAGLNKNTFGAIKEQFADLPRAARENAYGAMLTMAKTLEANGRLPEGTAKRLKEKMNGYFKDTRDFAEKSGKQLVTRYDKSLAPIIDTAGGIVRGMKTIIKDGLGGVMKGIGNFFGEVGRGVKRFFSDLERNPKRADRTANKAGQWANRIVQGAQILGWRDGGYIVPGPSDRDGTLAMLSGDEVVLTGSGQQMLDMAAPGLLDQVVAGQLPHFRNGGRLTPGQMAGLAHKRGLPNASAIRMGAIGMRESGGDPRAQNLKHPDHSIGLWQINQLAHKGRYGTDAQLKNAERNSRAMAALWRQSREQPWFHPQGDASFSRWLDDAERGFKVNGVRPHGTVGQRAAERAAAKSKKLTRWQRFRAATGLLGRGEALDRGFQSGLEGFPSRAARRASRYGLIDELIQVGGFRPPSAQSNTQEDPGRRRSRLWGRVNRMSGQQWRPGGGWGGSKQLVHQAITPFTSGQNVSYKRPYNTGSGVSDHWTQSKQAYAADISPGSDSIFRGIARRIGIPAQKGSWNNFPGKPIPGYRSQLLWHAPDGSHKDHVHFGIRKLRRGGPVKGTGWRGMTRRTPKSTAAFSNRLDRFSDDIAGLSQIAVESIRTGMLGQLGQLLKRKQTPKIQAQVQRLRAALDVVEEDVGRFYGGIVRQSQKAVESIDAQTTGLQRYFRVFNIDESSVQGLEATKALLEQQHTLLTDQASTLAMAANSARAQGLHSIADAIEEELKGVTDAIWENVATQFETARALILAPAQNIADAADRFRSIGAFDPLTLTGLGGDAGFQMLERTQQLDKTFDTAGGRAARASYINSTILPAIDSQIATQQDLYRAAISVGDTALAEQIASTIAGLLGDRMDAQIQVSELIEGNTAETAAALRSVGGNLGFEFGGQGFTDILTMGVGV
jgi:hypothetical protein